MKSWDEVQHVGVLQPLAEDLQVPRLEHAGVFGDFAEVRSHLELARFHDR